MTPYSVTDDCAAATPGISAPKPTHKLLRTTNLLRRFKFIEVSKCPLDFFVHLPTTLQTPTRFTDAARDSLASNGDAQILDHDVVVDTVVRPLAAEPRLLDAAERRD